jgi:hypothetical protein
VKFFLVSYRQSKGGEAHALPPDHVTPSLSPR